MICDRKEKSVERERRKKWVDDVCCSDGRRSASVISMAKGDSQGECAESAEEEGDSKSEGDNGVSRYVHPRRAVTKRAT